jgi:hypothetical protein
MLAGRADYGASHRVVALRDGVHIERWSEEDLALLTALNGDPAQMRHVGGAESPEKTNAVCRKLGFSLVEAGMSFAFPPGATMVVNDWRWEG